MISEAHSVIPSQSLTNSSIENWPPKRFRGFLFAHFVVVGTSHFPHQRRLSGVRRAMQWLLRRKFLEGFLFPAQPAVSAFILESKRRPLPRW